MGHRHWAQFFGFLSPPEIMIASLNGWSRVNTVDTSSSAGTSAGVVSVDELNVVEGDDSVAHGEHIVLVARPD